VFGKAGSFGTSFNLSDINGRNGFVINGIDADDYSGSVSQQVMSMAMVSMTF
jgi:hypothetical protein